MSQLNSPHLKSLNCWCHQLVKPEDGEITKIGGILKASFKVDPAAIRATLTATVEIKKHLSVALNFPAQSVILPTSTDTITFTKVSDADAGCACGDCEDTEQTETGIYVGMLNVPTTGVVSVGDTARIINTVEDLTSTEGSVTNYYDYIVTEVSDNGEVTIKYTSSSDDKDIPVDEH